MLKRLLLSMVGIFMIAITSTAQETSPWSAYLFDNINYDLIRINSDGTSEVFALNIAENEYLSTTDISISHDGRYAAYCKSTYLQENQSMGTKTLIIDEIGVGEILNMPYGELAACSVTAFSEDDSLIALSIVHYNAFDTIPDDGVSWSLRLVDAQGNVHHTLSSNDDFMPDYTLFGDNIPLFALVSDFNAEAVRFTGIPYVGMGGPSHVPAYEWNIEAQTVTELNIEFGRTNNDYLPETGELVYPALDENLPSAQPEGPLAQANIVNVMESDGTIRTVYHNETWSIVSTTFVNDGESIAVFLLPGFEAGMQAEELYTARIELVHRDGTVTTLDTEFDGGIWLDNTPDGMLIVSTPNPSQEGYDATNILLWDGNTLATVAEYLPDYTNGWSPPQLLWVTPSTVDETLPSFVSTI